MTTLRIADNLSLPRNIITQTFAVLAIKGAGKTYTMLKMGEEFLKKNLPVVFIDSMGVCWGLRASASGKGPGLPILVMGGDHGDVPLEPTAGAIVARFVVKERISVVLDLSGMRKGEQKRFVLEFAEELYHKNRKPMHLMADEADLWAPQKPQKGQERLLGAIEDLVRRGRARGIGVTMATQRAAVLNKNVLSQAEVLVAMRTISSKDRKAIDEWIEANGTPEKREEVMNSLATLKNGEAWIWSPSYLKIFKRIKIAIRDTYDSSKTPEIGKRVRAPKKLARVDLAKISEAIAATIERAKGEDPRLLKDKIKGLELEVTKLKITKPAPAPPPERVVHMPSPRLTQIQTKIKEIKREIPIIKKGDMGRLDSYARWLSNAAGEAYRAAKYLEKSGDDIAKVGKLVEKLLQETKKLAEMAKHPVMVTAPIIPVKTPIPLTKKQLKIVAKASAASKSVPVVSDDPSQRPLLAGERKMLQMALSFHPKKLTRSQMGLLCGIKMKGSTFGTYIGTVRGRGYLEGDDDGFELTPKGLKVIEKLDIERVPLGSPQEVQELWQTKLLAGERKIVQAAMKAYPEEFTKEWLGKICNIDPNGSTMGTYLGHVRGCGLLVGDNKSMTANPDLFVAVG